MIRSYDDPYKYNRCTEREGWLLKVKEFRDSEAIIEGFVEMQHNHNEATVDELGLAKRSTHQANKKAAGTLGVMIGRDIHSGQIVTIGPGKMKADEKLHVWSNQGLYLGKISKYRYAPYGVKELPRFPRHIVWRDPLDMS
jgi:DNA ligase-1